MTRQPVQGTIDSYRRKLGRLYRALPQDNKLIRRDTLPWWRERLAEEGCSPSGINQFVIVANGYLEYMGAREFQIIERLDASGAPLPELTRSEYLRLLGAAQVLGREQAYLLVKVFGNSDLPVQKLPRLTVEAARAGMVSISHRCSKEIIRFPSSVCRELLDYAGRRGIRSGSIFITRTGNLISRMEYRIIRQYFDCTYYGGKTVVSREYESKVGFQTFPKPSKRERNQYQKYRKLADETKNLYLCGRLAEYRFISIADSIGMVMSIIERLNFKSIDLTPEYVTYRPTMDEVMGEVN